MQTAIFTILLVIIWTCAHFIGLFQFPDLGEYLIPDNIKEDLQYTKTPHSKLSLSFFIISLIIFFALFIYAGVLAGPNLVHIIIRILIMYVVNEIYGEAFINRYLYTHTSFYSKLYKHYTQIESPNRHIVPESKNSLTLKIFLGIPGCLFVSLIIWLFTLL
jgi:hypothetical protein